MRKPTAPTIDETQLIEEHATQSFPRTVPTGRRRSRLSIWAVRLAIWAADFTAAVYKPVIIVALLLTGLSIGVGGYFTIDQMRCEERVTAMHLTYHYTALGGCYIVGGDGGHIPLGNFTLQGN